MSISDIETATHFLLGRVNYETFQQMPYAEMRQNLERLKRFLTHLGRPDLRYPILHVAGTKGKGSVCAMLDAILSSSGYRVGRFTSPHLHRINERFTVNNIPISDSQLVEIVRDLETQWRDGAFCDRQRELTFFEWSVLTAFDFFAHEQVDVAVIEVGLGGRFDATNICEPALSVITSISLEHTEQLGNTRRLIAAEKAGIIKPGVPVISGVESRDIDDPQEVIRHAAMQNNALFVESGRDFAMLPNDLGSFDFVYETGTFEPIRNLTVNPLGKHQRHNAALAIAAVCQLQKTNPQRWERVSRDAVRNALATLEIPARVERWRMRQPAIIIDGAHNQASAAALLEAISTLIEQERPTKKWLLFGSTIGKDVQGMLETLLPFFDHVVLSRYQNQRAFPIETLREIATTVSQTKQSVESLPSVDAALKKLLIVAEPNDLICITGSLYFAAEARAMLFEIA